MKKLIYLVLMGAAVTVYGQTAKKSLVFANGMIANKAQFKASSILATNVITKKASLPQELSSFETVLENNTITTLKIKESDFNDDRIALKDLNQQFNVNEASPVLIDGILVTNVDTLILGGALGQMETKIVDGKNLLSITTQTVN